MSDPRYPGQPPSWPPTGPPQPGQPGQPGQPDQPGQANRGAAPGGPSYPGQQPYGADQVGYAGGWDASVYGGDPLPAAKGSRWPWIALGCGVLVVLLVLAVGTVLILSARGGASGPADPGRSPVAGPTSVPGGTPSPPVPQVAVPPSKELPTFKGEGAEVTGRINDPKAGFSYARFGKPWEPMTQPWGDFTAGQEFVTERGNDGETWHATVFSGPLPDDVQAYCSGPGTLPKVAAAAASQYAASYYPSDVKRTGIASQPVEIDGHPAYIIGFELTFEQPYPGMTVTRETAVIAAIDTGKKYPGVLYVSIPGTHYQLRPDINTALDSVKIPGPKPTTGPSGQPTQPPTAPPLDGGSPDQEGGCGAPKPSPSTKF